MSAFIKDISTQFMISNGLFYMSFIHTLVFYIKDPTKLVDSYPIIKSDVSTASAYGMHLWFYIRTLFNIFMWSLITVYIAFFVFVALKVLVIDIIQAPLRRKDEANDLTISDIHDLMTRALWKDSGLIQLLKNLIAQVVAAFVVASFVTDPGSMKVTSQRITNIRVFLGVVMIVQLSLLISYT
jgi:hypothetical protein